MVISAITIPSLRYPLGQINEADAALSATRSLAASRRSDPSSAIRAALGWAAHPTCTQLANPCRTLRLQQEAEQVPLRPSSPAPRLRPPCVLGISPTELEGFRRWCDRTFHARIAAIGQGWRVADAFGSRHVRPEHVRLRLRALQPRGPRDGAQMPRAPRTSLSAARETS